MNVFKKMIDDGLGVWKDTTPAAKIGIGLLAALCILIIGFVGYWSAKPSYVNLVSDVGHEKMAKIIDELEKAGITYELGGAGGVLKVDNRQFAKARMIARGQGISVDQADDKSEIGGMWLDPTDRKNVEIRKKETGLAATIGKFDVVQSAVVHLNVPVKGPFERKTSKPTASVMLTLSPGQRLSQPQVESIAGLVANAIQDLDPKSVRIADKAGNGYSVGDELASSVSSQIDFVTASESKLARKAESQLARILGFENASVQVSLDLTFQNGSKTTIKYDNKGKVPSLEDTTLRTTTEDRSKPNGVVGVTANTNSGRQNSDSAVTDKNETIKTTYLVPKTEETEATTTPIRNFMSVSVIVNSAAEGMKDASGIVPDSVKTKIESIVKNAVGFRQDTDSISVTFMDFAPPVEIPVAEPINWIQINKLVQNISLSIAAISAVIFGMMTLRKFRPGGNNKPVELDAQKRRTVSSIARVAEKNPEVFAQIIKGWANGNAPSGENQTENKNAA